MKRRCSTLVALLAALGVPYASAVTVTTLSDSGPGSLRAAIAAGGDIDFAVTGTITLTSGALAINSSLVISGPGADHLTVQRSAADATPAFRVLRVEGGSVTISGLTIRNGFAAGSDRDGGGILNRGSLTLNDCVITSNRSDANGRGAGLYNAYAAALTVNRCVFANNVTAEGEGGGIYVFGEATVNDTTFRENRGAGPYSRGGGLHVDYFGTGHVARCTFSGNSVAGVNAQGGGIYNYGELDIVNSTFSGNSSGGTGGGLHVDALSRGTTIRNCTITGNSATEGAGIYNNGFQPYNTERITIADSIVAGNSSAAEDIDNSGVINSGGHNLFGVIAGDGIVAGAGDRFGLGADALRLGPLANNGGPTQTRALLAGSPAIDTGNETVFPDTDQRGVLRPFGARADIGAFELDQVLPTNQPPTVSIISPANGATFTAPENIFLIASVHDADGIATAATVEFFAGTIKLGDGQPFDPGPPHDAAFLFYWTNVPPGEYNLTARVTDDQGAMGTSAPVHIRVQGADNLPVVRITATDPNAAEPDDPGTFTVSRDGPTNNTLNVYYLIGGSASNGLDYVTLSNWVTVPAGVRSAQISVAPIDDILVEGLERVEIRLVPPPIRPPVTYVIGSPSNAVVSIYDNDPPPTNQPPTITIVSPANGASFTAPANILLLASVHDPDGIAWAATVELFAGTNKIGNGQLHDPGPPHDAAFLFYWTDVPPGEYSLTAKVTDDQGAIAFSPPVHIRVQGADNLPVVRITATDPNAAEPDDPGTFTVFRDGPTNNTLQVYYLIGGSASNGVDYVTLGNWVTVPAGVRSAQISVAPIDDAVAEGLERVELRLVPPPILPPATYVIGSPSNAVVSIYDNEPPPTNQPPTITLITPTNGATFTAPANIFVMASVHDPDGIAWAATVEFFAGTNKIGNGYIFDPGPLHDAIFRFSWTNVPPGEYDLTAKVTDDHGGTAFSPPVHIRVQGANYFPVVTVIATDPTAAEPDSSGMFTIYRTGSTNFPISVFYSFSGTASNGVDYLTPPNPPVWPSAYSVTIPAGANSVSIPITPRDDNLVEGPETVVLRLEYCSDFAPCYDIGWPSNAVVTILDNDPPPDQPIVTIEATDAHASEPGVLPVLDPGVFTVYRAGNTSATLYVHYRIDGTASNGVDYLAISNIVVIPAGATSARILINPLHDLLTESTETVALRLEDPICIAIYPPPPDCYRVGTPREAAVYIADSDHAPTNHPPTVRIFTPTNGASFVAPANIFIAANAQDLDGYLTIQTVEFFAGARSLGIRTNYPTVDPIGPFKLVWTNVPSGSYVLTARARDSGGAFGISPPVEIRVVETNHPPTNDLPIVTIAASDAIAAEGTNCWHWPGWSNSPTGNLCLTNTATFVVRRTGDTNTSLSVLYEIGGTARNGVDYAALPGSVTIPAGHRAAEIMIVPVDDALPERIETVVLALVARPAGSDVPPYVVGRPRRAAAIIVDNDQPRPTTGMLPDRNFHLMRPRDNGTWWRIEGSTNLVHWSVLGTNSVTDGAVHFVDPDGDELPQRFYRAVPELNPPDE